MCEIWKFNKEYDIYISSYGNVKREDGFMYKIQICKSNGYRYVHLYKNNKTVAVKVARLVANAFLLNPDGKPCVDHIDTIRTNDAVTNLRWVTRSENMQNPITIQNRKNLGFVPKPKAKKQIAQFNKDGSFLRFWDSATDFGLSINKEVSGNIIACIKGIQKSAYGYKWKYA